MEETYILPPHGWTCFHCGETFTRPGAARDHFGGTVNALTACRIKSGDEMGLLMRLRRAEEELARLGRTFNERTWKWESVT